MRKRKKILKTLAYLVIGCLLFQTASCGFILYPERRGRGPRVGRIDPGVAVLDSLLLLVFIVPGVVALAVDFTTGAIYVANEGDSINPPDAEVVDNETKNNDVATLERILSDKNGRPIHLNPDQIKVLKVTDPEYIKHHFVKTGLLGNYLSGTRGNS